MARLVVLARVDEEADSAVALGLLSARIPASRARSNRRCASAAVVVDAAQTRVMVSAVMAPAADLMRAGFKVLEWLDHPQVGVVVQQRYSAPVVLVEQAQRTRQ